MVGGGAAPGAAVHLSLALLLHPSGVFQTRQESSDKLFDLGRRWKRDPAGPSVDAHLYVPARLLLPCTRMIAAPTTTRPLSCCILFANHGPLYIHRCCSKYLIAVLLRDGANNSPEVHAPPQQSGSTSTCLCCTSPPFLRAASFLADSCCEDRCMVNTLPELHTMAVTAGSGLKSHGITCCAFDSAWF